MKRLKNRFMTQNPPRSIKVVRQGCQAYSNKNYKNKTKMPRIFPLMFSGKKN